MVRLNVLLVIMCVDGRTDVSRRCIYETKTLSMRFGPVRCIRFDCQTCANALMATIYCSDVIHTKDVVSTNLCRHSAFSIQLQKIYANLSASLLFVSACFRTCSQAGIWSTSFVLRINEEERKKT